MCKKSNDTDERLKITPSWSKDLNSGRLALNKPTLKELAKNIPDFDIDFLLRPDCKLIKADFGQIKPVLYNVADIELGSVVEFTLHTLRFDTSACEVKYSSEVLYGSYHEDAYTVKTSTYGLAIYETSPHIENISNSLWVAKIAGDMTEEEATHILAEKILHSIKVLSNSWNKIREVAEELLGAATNTPNINSDKNS